MDPSQLCFNGIDGASGEYLLPPLSASDVASLARGERLDADHLAELKHWWDLNLLQVAPA